MMDTEFLGICDSKVFRIQGVDIFKLKWKTLGSCAVVLHPKTKKAYTFSLYEVYMHDEVVTFAYGEFNDGKKAFYKVIK